MPQTPTWTSSQKAPPDSPVAHVGRRWQPWPPPLPQPVVSTDGSWGPLTRRQRKPVRLPPWCCPWLLPREKAQLRAQQPHEPQDASGHTPLREDSKCRAHFQGRPAPSGVSGDTARDPGAATSRPEPAQGPRNATAFQAPAAAVTVSSETPHTTAALTAWGSLAARCQCGGSVSGFIFAMAQARQGGQDQGLLSPCHLKQQLADLSLCMAL